MASVKISVSLPDDVVRRMDEARGKRSRSGFIAAALYERLAAGEPSGQVRAVAPPVPDLMANLKSSLEARGPLRAVPKIDKRPRGQR